MCIFCTSSGFWWDVVAVTVVMRRERHNVLWDGDVVVVTVVMRHEGFVAAFARVPDGERKVLQGALQGGTVATRRVPRTIRICATLILTWNGKKVSEHLGSESRNLL